MTVDADRGYEIGGPLILGGVAIYVGAVVPYDIPLVNAPINSIYIQSNGSIWKKIDSGDLEVDWRLIQAPLGQVPDLVVSGETLSILSNKQIVVMEAFEVEDGGTLIIEENGTSGTCNSSCSGSISFNF